MTRVLWLAAVSGSVLTAFPAETTTNAVCKKEITENGLVADLFCQKGKSGQRGIILLGGSEGGKAVSGMTREIQDLVDKGYAALVLAYFGQEGLPPTLQSIPLEYFNKAVDWLSRQPFADSSGVCVIGGSKGAEAALLLASTNPKVKSVVAISPSAFCFWGIRGPGGKDETVSSWSYGGRDVPFVPVASSPETIRKAMQAHEFITIYREAIAGPDAARALIRVEDMKGPILLISGKRDKVWPSQEMAERIVARLKQKEFPYEVNHLSYDAGHNVTGDAKECWPAVLRFIEKHYPSRSARKQ
jgi:dienelactone hydrolase